MAKPNVINLNDLFGTDEGDILESSDVGIKEVYLYKLIPFRNHPFKLYEGQRLQDMIESIKEHGVITPIIVRPMAVQEEQYEILSGHNRANAAKIVGLEKIPAVIKEGLTDEEAMLIVTETNLIQRSFADLSHSERARVLVEHYNAIKHQGKKIDLINEIETLSNTDNFNENSDSSQLATKGRTDAKVGENYNLSKDTVARYLKIDALIKELKSRLDKEEIPFIAAVNLSFLKVDEQNIIEEILKEKNFKVDMKKAEILKSFSQGRNLNYDKAHEVLSGKYFDKPKKAKSFKLKPKLVSKYFNENQTQKEIEEIIENALEIYFSKKDEIE
ncbi:ParB/RepB/Spo0J family partition protein [Alkaliphilus sp. B6464]|uniref:ParB/RepB/Spo0J family partition protein n=1 Tax=Alkaliphilus sp. B6464 TaxID=2731219 RepID=UPI001BAA8129|nr:ParB N-terminal domain-containing protein [Alkaliphilus sp. B6464]QUH20388.1 ParB/RepB/Spo0J family partition protein [Alkaliphilus sp. B6464]